MSSGFVLEFSVDVADDGNDPAVEWFRVLVDAGGVRAFEAFSDPFGGTRWIEALDEGAARVVPFPKYKVVGWGIGGYINAEHRIFERLPNGLEIIKLGIIKREA